MSSDLLETGPAEAVRALRDSVGRFMMTYQFGMDEVMTKVRILQAEFGHTHEYNPIEHVSSRLKTPDSILAKIERKGCELDLDDVRATIRDIAGIRITCSFISDIWRVRDMLVGQQDITLLDERDYITVPKSNGYQSLHLIIQVPVFMSDRVEHAVVEVQIRTIAMDFWASLEHKIYYKYGREVPESLLGELREAATAANRLDVKMESLHKQVLSLGGRDRAAAADARATVPTSTADLIEAILGRVRSREPSGSRAQQA